MTMGRPPIDVDWTKLETYCQYKVTLVDCASLLDMSDRTLETKIRDKYDLTFFDYREQKMARTRINLFSKQVEIAMGGNTTMLIWLGKNNLGQTDKNELNLGEETQKAFNLAYKLDRDKPPGVKETELDAT